MASTRQTRNTKRNQTHNKGIDSHTDEHEQSSEDDATPSTSFIETANPARNPHDGKTNRAWMESVFPKRKKHDEITH